LGEKFAEEPAAAASGASGERDLSRSIDSSMVPMCCPWNPPEGWWTMIRACGSE